MNKEKVFAWIESLEDMADQSDKYFVERNELYRENQEKDKEIDRLNNIINELEKHIGQEWYCFDNESIEFKVARDILDKLKELKENNNE